MRILRRRFWFIPLFALFSLTALNATDSATGVGLWLAWTLYPTFLLMTMAEGVYLVVGRMPRWIGISLLTFLASAFCFIAGEIALAAYEKLTSDAPKLVMPREWERRPANVEGSPDSFYWHGALHMKDEKGFRHVGPWPAKDPARVRVLVVGDSLTYGLGVKMEETYPAVLGMLLSAKYEVLNLGVVGLNSTQILDVLKRKVPELHPDLIIYGVCINDFLPFNKAQERGDDSYSPPIPYWLRDPLITRTRLGQALNTGYNKLLLKFHLRKQFIDEIFDHPEWMQRFGKDVVEMNRFVRERDLPPIIAMVLDQYPAVGSPSQILAERAEMVMAQVAEINVIPTLKYYHEHNGKAYFVSPWEGHPNAEAHRIFASILAAWING